MKTFHAPAHAQHAPQFFLMRGKVHPNFEIPARAEALLAALHTLKLPPETAPPAPRAALEAIHPAPFLNFLATAHPLWSALPNPGPEAVANIHPTPEMLTQSGAPGGIIAQLGWYTADTACPIGPHTWQASLDAAACALAAASEAAQGRNAYALCRPPGHHTYASRAGGHCYLNNAAIAAQSLLDQGAKRVAILDIDSHHGNGTQGIFWTRPEVLTISLHGDPDGYYPWYVGRAHETGAGPGQNFNLNLPQPHGTPDAPYLEALSHALARIRTYAPDALVLALGFDASIHEPLNYLSLSNDAFARAGAAIASLNLPTAITQEGGYAVDHLATLLTRFLDGFLGR